MNSLKDIRTKETALNLSFNVKEVIQANKPNINMLGYIDTYSGYANHCRNILDQLNSIGKYNVKLNALQSISDVDPTVTSRYKNNIYMDKFNYENSIQLAITAPGYLEHLSTYNAKKRFVWTMTETDFVPKPIAKMCKKADTIICPTYIDKDKFASANVNNTVVCPLGYDEKLYNSETPRLDIANLRGRYVFGVVGSWNARKNQKDIVKAFCKAFTKNSEVSLLIVSKYAVRNYNNNATSIKEELDECITSAIEENELNSDNLPHITIIEEPIHESVMPLLMSRIDCLVGFSCGESTWLPGLEIAAIGRPIIQLGNIKAGYMDYLNKTPYLCDTVENKEVGENFYLGISEYYKDTTMAFGDYKELSEMMIEVYKDKDSSMQNREVENLRKEVAIRTWKDSINKLIDILF